MSKIRIIIAGGRDFNDYKLLEKESLRIISECFGQVQKDDIEIVSGGANGADKLGELFAKNLNFACHRIPAKWNTYGKSAGFMRNGEMADYAIGRPEEHTNPLVIAFWDGKSRGTKHMIDTAERRGIKVVIVRYNQEF